MNQGSQQLQGEVAEIRLEQILAGKFPSDAFEAVPKGTPGGDVIQKVPDHMGNDCGTIVWEVKRTKNWSDLWIEKLKEDVARVKGNYGVIVATTLPKGVLQLAFYNGIWVTDFASAVGLATALRLVLTEVNLAKIASIGKNQKVEALYHYLTGPHFRQRVQRIVETFQSMRKDLDAEKRAVTKYWAKREKQIELTITHTTGMYGDLEAIIGGDLPQIEEFEYAQLRTSAQLDEAGSDTDRAGSDENMAEDDLPF